MGNRVFLNKKFSNYLGEQRALLDIIVRYESVIPPSPTSVTPTPTPTPSASPIPPTPTQTPTTTLTLTASPTQTATATPQPTATPTNTPSPSPVVQNYLLFENDDIIETEQGDLLEPNL